MSERSGLIFKQLRTTEPLVDGVRMKPNLMRHLAVFRTVDVTGLILVFVPELSCADVSDFSQSAGPRVPRLPMLRCCIAFKLVQTALFQYEFIRSLVGVASDGGRCVAGSQHLASEREPFRGPRVEGRALARLFSDDACRHYAPLTRVLIRNEFLDDWMHSW